MPRSDGEQAAAELQDVPGRRFEGAIPRPESKYVSTVIVAKVGELVARVEFPQRVASPAQPQQVELRPVAPDDALAREGILGSTVVLALELASDGESPEQQPADHSPARLAAHVIAATGDEARHDRTQPSDATEFEADRPSGEQSTDGHDAVAQSAGRQPPDGEPPEFRESTYVNTTHVNTTHGHTTNGESTELDST